MKDVQSAHLDLQAIAKQIMLEHGFEPDFSAAGRSNSWPN